MINTTRWFPDTCKCVIEHDWTWIDPIKKEGVDSLEIRLVSPCEFHKSHTGDEVLSENQTKNKSINYISEKIPGFSKTDEHGNRSPDLSKISFSFDSQRNIIITAKGINETDRLKMVSDLEILHGNNKVKVNG